MSELKVTRSTICFDAIKPDRSKSIYSKTIKTAPSSKLKLLSSEEPIKRIRIYSMQKKGRYIHVERERERKNEREKDER
jgi:hypothetical protein